MDSKNPITGLPRFWRRLLRWFCHPAYLEDIEGDLKELYDERVLEVGPRKARWCYIGDVLLLIRPALIRPLEGSSRLTQYGMVKNYFISAITSHPRVQTK